MPFETLFSAWLWRVRPAAYRRPEPGRGPVIVPRQVPRGA